MKKSLDLSELHIKNSRFMEELDRRKSPFYHQIITVFKEVESLINSRIAYIFPYYTQHDIKHSISIQKYDNRFLLSFSRKLKMK